MTYAKEKLGDSRQTLKDCPKMRIFNFTRDMVYNRVKYVFNKAGIENASTHTLRKTAGAWYYAATRDIFATSRFLGHSSVKVTERHYAGLIQSLQVEYSEMYEATLNSRLLLGCYSETKQDQSRLNPPNLSNKEKPQFIVDKQGFLKSGIDGARTRDLRLDRPAF